MNRDECNRSRFLPEDRGGHYESWFQRANHAERPLGFWIRYTVFSPRGHPSGHAPSCGRSISMASAGASAPPSRSFRSPRLASPQAPSTCRIGDARLDSCSASSARRTRRAACAARDPHEAPPPIRCCSCGRRSTTAACPRRRRWSSSPNASFSGSLVVDGETVEVDGWLGSQNHNWGSKHTDEYAWGQVAGFDGAPGTFLECSTARLKIGPLWTPRLTLVVLRLEDREDANGIAQALRAEGSFDFGSWRLRTRSDEASIEGRFRRPPRPSSGWSTTTRPEARRPASTASCGLRAPGRAARAAGADPSLEASRRLRDPDRAHRSRDCGRRLISCCPRG